MEKAVILAGGAGTRMRPATLLTNKHLLPIYSDSSATPMLLYPIQTLIKSGITDILVISSREHCGHIIEHLSDGTQFGADFTYKIQDTDHVPLGIASALKLAKHFTGMDKFVVILGDNFYADTFESEFEKFTVSDAKSAVFLKKVEDIHRFGCATVDENLNVTKIVEKPKHPESNWAVTGLYLYSSHVYEILPQLSISDRGEVEITDLNNWYVNNKSMSATFLRGFWSDMGTPISAKKIQKFIEENHFEISLLDEMSHPPG